MCLELLLTHTVLMFDFQHCQHCSVCFPPRLQCVITLGLCASVSLLLSHNNSITAPPGAQIFGVKKMVLLCPLCAGTISHLILKMRIIHYRAACLHKMTVVVKFITASRSGFCQLKGIFSDKHPGRGSEHSLHLSINPYNFSNIHPCELEAE